MQKLQEIILRFYNLPAFFHNDPFDWKKKKFLQKEVHCSDGTTSLDTIIFAQSSRSSAETGMTAA